MTILIATGLIVGFFFIAHGQALRWYMLFLGVMSSLYSVYESGGHGSQSRVPSCIAESDRYTDASLDIQMTLSCAR